MSQRFARPLASLVALAVAAIALAPLAARAATCTATAAAPQPRLWSAAATWSCGSTPAANDRATVPNGATVILDVDTPALARIQIQAGGTLRGDGTGRAITINSSGGADVINDGTLDFAPPSSAILRFSNTARSLGITQTVGAASTWRLSVIDFANVAASFSNIGQIELAGSATPFQNTTRTVSMAGTTALTWLFSGSSQQTISAANIANMPVFTSAAAPSSFAVTNSGGNGLVLQANLTLRGTLSVSAGALLSMEGTSNALLGAAAKTFSRASSVRYASAGAQTVSAETYGHLVLAGGGTKTPAAGTTTIAGDFTLAAATTYAGSTNNPIANLAGNFTNAGTFDSGSGVFTFDGDVAQTLSGATTFSRLTLASSAPIASRTLTLANDVTVSSALAFTSGRVVTGASKLIVPSGGSVTGAGAASGWVAGRLQKSVPAGASSVSFEIGTNGASAPSLAYSPISAAFTGVSSGGGNVIASATTGDHPQIASSALVSARSVNRWWSLTTSGVSGTALPAFTSYSPTLTFVPGDVDAGANTTSFVVERWSGTSWSDTQTGTRTATTTQATGVTALGELAIAEQRTPSVTKIVAAFSDPVNGATRPKSIPGGRAEYVVIVSNPAGPLDGDSVFVSDPIPANTVLYTGDLGSSGSGPVAFSDGATTSGLSYAFAGLGSGSDDVAFSADGGATWNHIPIADPVTRCDTSGTTRIRVNPKGVFASGVGVTPDPSFAVKFHVCVQ